VVLVVELRLEAVVLGALQVIGGFRITERGFEVRISQQPELALELCVQVCVRPADELWIELACIVFLSEDIVSGVPCFDDAVDHWRTIAMGRAARRPDESYAASAAAASPA